MLAPSLNKIAEQPDDTLIDEINDPAVRLAARHLVTRHRSGQTFDISAFDVPHAALVSISEQLEEAGVSHAMSSPLIAGLRRYIMSTGGSFVRAVNAKPVVIRLMVGNRMPDRRFENGMTELSFIGSSEVRVEGASSINVRATPTGTATTSNAADVDAMFANVKGTHLWVRFEAPTKQDLDGLMTSMEAALAGAAQSLGGAMSAGDFKELLEKLQAEGALTPAAQSLIENLIALQEGAGKLSADTIAEIVGNISALIESAKETGLIPPELVQAVMTSMAELPENAAIADFLAEQGFEAIVADNDNLLPEQKLEELMEKIEALQDLEGLDPEIQDKIAELLEQVQEGLDAENPDIQAVLATLTEGLAELAANENVPQTLFDSIGEILPEIASLKEDVANNAAMEMTQGEQLLEIIEDIASKIESGEMSPEDVAPELAELIEQMGGVDAILNKEGREARIETLSNALASENSSLTLAIQAAMPVIAEIKSLPAALAETVSASMRTITPSASVPASPVSNYISGASGWSSSSVRNVESVSRPLSQPAANTPNIVSFVPVMPSFSVREVFTAVQVVTKNTPSAPKQEAPKPEVKKDAPKEDSKKPAPLPLPKNDGVKPQPAPADPKPNPKPQPQPVPANDIPAPKEKGEPKPIPDGKIPSLPESHAPKNPILEPAVNDKPQPAPEKPSTDPSHDKKDCCSPEAKRSLEQKFEEINANSDSTKLHVKGDDVVITNKDGQVITTISVKEYHENERKAEEVRDLVKEINEGQKITSLDIERQLAELPSGGMHVHFNGCCGTGSNGGKTSVENDNDNISKHMTVVKDGIKSKDVSVKKMQEDEITKKMTQAFGYSDFKI
ncbi:MAG: hypothetical protein DI626_02240 [Micavibrio aeruginosavorus]|uniref:Uncharacterized protein n=1 Tax=Micavibrio aeruginosavorus TaxID=349221 RepID=A0A2W5A3V9_9BACT|nr:MAG: hypothetical protein DI626_02240 [Micavibrio aeruginosavorus]